MKICIWGNVTDAIMGITPGGAELQIALLAKALKQNGNDVVIIDPSIKEDIETEDGIKIFSVRGWDKGIRILRTFTHRLPQFYKLLKEQEADIYYCRIRDFRHIFSYWAAKKVNAKFILALASDLDILSFGMRCKHSYFTQLSGPWLYLNGLLVEAVYPYLTRKSDKVFVQHEGQLNILQKKNIDALIVSNLIDLKVIPSSSENKRNEFVYVGAFDKRKGFQQFFELVQKCPECMFRVIGLPRDRTGNKYYEKLKSFNNVILMGWLSHSKTISNISKSIALISTSPMEGFPNIFIESWACEVPVLSLFVDPGSVIEKEKLGYFANGRVEVLIEKVKYFNTNKITCENGKDYVAKTHALNEQKQIELNSIFEKIVHSR